MNTLNGLPAHILLVHAVVVLLPLAAGLLVLCAASARARARFAGANALLAVATLALVPLTTGAGEWLQARVDDTALVRDHADLGGTALFVAVPVAVLALVVWWREREAGTMTQETGPVVPPGGPVPRPLHRTWTAPGSASVTAVVLGLAVLTAGATVYDVYRIGDSGARASWEKGFSPTPLTRP